MSIRARFIILLLVGGFVVWPIYYAEGPGNPLRQARADGCRTSSRVVSIRVSVSKYPANWKHIVDARNGRNTGGDGVTVVDNGLRWPTILTKNDVGEDARRTAGEKMSGLPAKPGLARDEYPPAEGRSTNAADFRYVDRRANSRQGASMGGQLRPYCNGQRYKLVAAP